MARPAQVANDLFSWSLSLDRTGQDRLVASLSRGAKTIRDLEAKVAELEAAAEAEAQKYEDYVHGEG